MTDKKRQRLDLPFVKRRKDTVTWIYDHRAGVFAVLALVLLMAILFVGSRIVIWAPEQADEILVDLRTVEELRQEAERLQRENRMLQSAADDAYIRNAISNEGAEERDDPRTNNSSLRDMADGVNGRLGANRDAWDQGMREIDAMGADKGDRAADSGKDTRAKGNVLVSFSLVDPLRLGDGLIKPGYMCERDGRVVVDITVNRNGDVVSAKVNGSLSDNDVCMHETALNAALNSRFNVDTSAPERHTGTITYTFVAQ